MNNDAISRRNVLETISYVKRRVIDCRDEGRLTERQSENVIYIADLFAELISDAPAIDVAPVVHARWIPSSVDPADPYFRCSNCHHGRDTIYFQGDEYNFCPHCGAKMDGEAE